MFRKLHCLFHLYSLDLVTVSIKQLQLLLKVQILGFVSTSRFTFSAAATLRSVLLPPQPYFQEKSFQVESKTSSLDGAC